MRIWTLTFLWCFLLCWAVFARATGVAETNVLRSIDAAILAIASNERWHRDAIDNTKALIQANGQGSRTPGVLDLDQEVRLALLDTMAQADALVAAQNTPETIRVFTVALRLLSSLEEASSSGTTHVTEESKRLRPIIWKRLAQLGGKQRRADMKFGSKIGRVLYRRFFVKDGVFLTYELYGSPASHSAEWEETRAHSLYLEDAPPKLRSALNAATTASLVVLVNTTRYPNLVATKALADRIAASSPSMRVVAIESSSQPAPFIDIASVRSDRWFETAPWSIAILHAHTGAVVSAWRSPPDDIAAELIALDVEISSNFGHSTSAETFPHPVVAATPDKTDIFLLRESSFASRGIQFPGKTYAGGAMLVMRTKLGSDWGLFEVVGTSAEAWFRVAKVRPLPPTAICDKFVNIGEAQCYPSTATLVHGQSVPLKEQPRSEGRTIAEVGGRDSLLILEHQGDWTRVIWQGKHGWLQNIADKRACHGSRSGNCGDAP